MPGQPLPHDPAEANIRAIARIEEAAISGRSLAVWMSDASLIKPTDVGDLAERVGRNLALDQDRERGKG